MDDLRKRAGAEITQDGYLVVQVDAREAVIRTLAGCGKQALPEGLNRIRLDLASDPFPIFPDEASFLGRLVTERFQADFAILDTVLGKPVLFHNETKTVRATDGTEPPYDFIANARFYLEFSSFLLEREIAVYHGTTARELVVNVPEYGAFTIGYEQSGKQHIPRERLGSGFDRLKKFLESPDSKPFLCKAVHQKLEPLEREKRYTGFLEALDEITEAAQRDHEVYLSKFSFDELKENFRSEREEYFKGFRDTIKSLSGIAVAVPVSLAAAAFAVERVKSNDVLLWLVTITYVVYTIVASYLVGLLHQDNVQTLNDLESDLATFREKVKSNSDLLAVEAGRISSRAAQVNGTIWFVRVELMGMATGLLIIVAAILEVSPVATFMASCLLFVFHVLVWIGRAVPRDVLLLEKDRSI